MLKRGALLVIGALVGGLLLVLIAVLVLFAIQTTRVAKRIEQRNETILTAIRDNTSSLEFLRQNLALLAEDSNAARAALKLPQRQYPILSAPPPAVASQDDSDVYLTAFDTLLRQRDRLVAERRFADIAGSAPLNELVSNNGLTEDHTAADRILLRRRGRTYFTVTVRSDSGNIRVTDALGKEMLARQIDSRLSQFVAQRIAPLDAHFARLQEQIDAVNAMRSAPKVVEFTKLHALTFSHPQDNGAQYSFSVIKDGQILMTVSLDERSFAARAGDRRYGNAEELSAAFLSDLSRLDLRT
ncbi:MAG TPA: hypothetical protein VMV68_06660, partial [Spirochaetia bacterium]|nr:hypothetical protein [Spirochaetia bacterium]